MSERIKLERKRCRLVQTGEFKSQETINSQGINGRKDIVDLHYMGSSEFEWGALPSSTIRMLINIDFYNIFTFDEYKDYNGDSLMVYAPVMFIEHIKDIVNKLAAQELWLIEKRWSLKEYLNKKDKSNDDNYYSPENFWWDIDNDFYIFFGEEKANLILQTQNSMREQSVGEVEVGDWDELSSYYSLVNQDISEEAREFLRPKKKQAVKKLVNVLNNRINKMTK